MAIQPRYAQAILSGAKGVEFRKRRLAADVDTVLIYESAPTQRIVGQFSLDRTVEASPLELWREFGSVGCIGRDDFMRYYEGCRSGVSLVVKGSVRYARPVALTELATRPAVPQSFAYLPVSTTHDIGRLQPWLPLVAARHVVGTTLQTSWRMLEALPLPSPRVRAR